MNAEADPCQPWWSVYAKCMDVDIASVDGSDLGGGCLTAPNGHYTITPASLLLYALFL